MPNGRKLRLACIVLLAAGLSGAGCSSSFLQFPNLGQLGFRSIPDLKPPTEPEVLASPGERDKRYTEPCCYPADQLASDPTRAALSQDAQTPQQKKASMGGMGGMRGPGGQ